MTIFLNQILFLFVFLCLLGSPLVVPTAQAQEPVTTGAQEPLTAGAPENSPPRMSDAFFAPGKGQSLVSLTANYDTERQQEILLTSLLAFDYDLVTTGATATYQYGLTPLLALGVAQNYTQQRRGNVDYSKEFEAVGAKDYQPIWRGPQDPEFSLSSVLGNNWESNLRLKFVLAHTPQVWHSIQATSGGDGTMGRGGSLSRASVIIGHKIYDILQFSGGVNAVAYGDRAQISAKGTTNYLRKGGNFDHFFGELRVHPNDNWSAAISVNKTAVKESQVDVSSALDPTAASSKLTVSQYEYQYFKSALWWQPNETNMFAFEYSSPSPGTVTILDGGISGRVAIERFEYRLGWTIRLPQ